jgi:hypothetical protein
MTELTLETGEHTVGVICECRGQAKSECGFISNCGTKVQKLYTSLKWTGLP